MIRGSYRSHYRRMLPIVLGALTFRSNNHGMDYGDTGASQHEKRYRRRVLANLQGRAKSLGYVLQAASKIAWEFLGKAVKML